MSKRSTVDLHDLDQYLAKILRIAEYDDYGPNGLQIEGREHIAKIAFAVSATRDSINQTIAQKADALIVHHGLFWKFHGPKTITGAFAKRVKPLIENNISLLGYHLPLDGHPTLGNAASLAQQLELSELAPFGMRAMMPTGIKGKFKIAVNASTLKEKMERTISHLVLHACPEGDPIISTLGIITGGANGEWKQALREGLDAYLTGEMSEHDWNEAREAGIHMFAGGHHATERFGVQALMEHLVQKYAVEAVFIDSENPA